MERITMGCFHRTVATSILIAITSISVAHAQGTTSATAKEGPKLSGLHDFDFLVGEWRVHHRLMRGGTQREEFDGTASNRPLMDGWANVEDHRFDRSAGVSRGVALRAYDAQTAQWAIWWVDSRVPHGAVDPPVKGRFENGVGTFYSDYVQDGKPMRVRFIWSHLTSKSAQWEQALSSDAGKTWETNWIMEFERSP
jgi:Protein of unknown function (DUF1579)